MVSGIFYLYRATLAKPVAVYHGLDNSINLFIGQEHVGKKTQRLYFFYK